MKRIVQICLLLPAIISPIFASTTDIPEGTNLSNLPSPQNGDIWNIVGESVYATSPINLPAGLTGLTINGLSTGSTISLNPGISNGNFTGSTVIFNLSNITLANGDFSNASAIESSGMLVLNTSGLVTLTNNTSSLSGGSAISTADVLAIYGDISVITNTSFDSGGAFSAGGDILIQGNSAFVNNVTENNGGAIYTNQSVRMIGNTNLSLNQSGLSGGGIYSNELVAISGNTILAGNIAQQNGGAIYGATGVSLDEGAFFIAYNQATLGGGIYSPALVTISGGVAAISNNAIAGGVINTATDLVLNAGAPQLFSENVASNQGGAAWVGQNATLNASGGGIFFLHNRENNANQTSISQANAIYFNNQNGNNTLLLNAINNITFYDPIESNSANGLLNVVKTGEGLVSFDGSFYSNTIDQTSNIYANTIVQEGSFEIANSAVYGMSIPSSAPTVFTTNPNTTLMGGKIGTLIADTFNLGGTLDIAGRQPAVRGTFVLNSSNITFNSGSTVVFNTFVNDAVVQDSDLLVLDLNNSAVKGQSSIIVNNVGGPGGVTVGNGIELVQANNGTTTNAFTLAAPVSAGPYEYLLFHGSLDNTGPENWYLRSEGIVDGDDIIVPLYRPEVSLYTSLPSLMLLYGRNQFDTLHQRVGDEYFGITGHEDENPKPLSLGWGRYIGLNGKIPGGLHGIYSHDGPRFHYSINAFQGGLDLYRDQNEDRSSKHGGMYGAIGQIEDHVTNYDHTFAGNNIIHAYTLGAYWTQFSSHGWYLDSLVQVTWGDLQAKPNTNHRLITHGVNLGFSLESGFPFRIHNRLNFEPQVQLIYQTGRINRTSDDAARVKFSHVNSLAGRIGSRFVYHQNFDQSLFTPRKLVLWLRPDVWQEFNANPFTSFSSETGFIPFWSNIRGTWIAINGGLDMKISEHTNLYGNLNYQIGLSKNGHAFGGNAGVRATW